MRSPLLAAAFVLPIPLALSAQEAGWTRFRGPNGSGVAHGDAALPDALVRAQALWRTELPPGHSSPVVAEVGGDARVFVTAADGDELWTYAIDAGSGEVVWRTEAPRDRTTEVDRRNNAASPTPVAGGGRVVVFFPDFGLLAYATADGDELWRHPLGPFRNVYGMGASPVLAGDRVILACDQNRGSFVLAVDAASGETLWKTARPRARSGHCTPILHGGELILPGSFLLDAYDPATGERRWWVHGLSFEMKSVPVVHEGLLFTNGYGSPLNQPGRQVDVPAFDEALAEHDANEDGWIGRDEMPDGRVAAWFGFVDLDGSKLLDREEWRYLRDALASQNGMIAVRLGGDTRGDRTESHVEWAYRRSVPQLPSPIVAGGVLYMLNDQGGICVLLDPENGEVVERGRLEHGIDNYYASPVAGDGKVFFVSEGGIVTVVRAGTLEEVSVEELAESCYATPAIAGGRMFVRSVEALYAFGR